MNGNVYNYPIGPMVCYNLYDLAERLWHVRNCVNNYYGGIK